MSSPPEDGSGRNPLPPIEIDAGAIQIGSNRQLTWAGSTDELQLNIDDVLLAVNFQGNPKTVAICCLKEEASELERPFQLILLRTNAALPEPLGSSLFVNQTPPRLQPGASRDVDIIVSVKSGTGLALAFWQDVLQPLLHLLPGETTEHPSGGTTTADGHAQRRVLITQSGDSVSQFARGLWPEPPKPPTETAKSRTIVLLSGDGGVVDLLNGRGKDAPADPQPLVALLPLGTGNAQFHSLHKPAYSDPGPSPLVLGVRTLLHGVEADLPVFRASFTEGSRVVTPGSAARPDKSSGIDTPPVQHLDGAIVASYGFHASIVYESDTPAYRVHGDKRFGMVAQDLLRESHPYAAHVEVRRPGSPQFTALPREHHAYVLTTLVSNLERAFTISPASKPLDGQLRVVHFGNVGGARIMEAMMKAYDEGKHVDLKWDDGERVYYEEVEEIRVTVNESDDRWRKVCVDGTIVDILEKGQMAVRKLDRSPLRILVNAQAVRS